MARDILRLVVIGLLFYILYFALFAEKIESVVVRKTCVKGHWEYPKDIAADAHNQYVCDSVKIDTINFTYYSLKR